MSPRVLGPTALLCAALLPCTTLSGACPADLSGDQTVGFADLTNLLAEWGSCPVQAPCPADFDLDGDVGFTDLTDLLADWGPCPDETDTDGDGIPDVNDPCPLDFPDDTDLDGICDSDDICPRAPNDVDSDGDGYPDGCDRCPGGDDGLDSDGDGVPNDCDACPFDAAGDTDWDGICDSEDPCVDPDYDGVCDPDDICPNGPDDVDSDNDGVPDGCDICWGFDDHVDTDGDGIPDGCDLCPDFPGFIDDDGDGICDTDDPCVDPDHDGVCAPDDLCPDFPDFIDTDGDGIPDDCDPCPDDNPDDSDGDGVCDSSDRCPGYDDFLDGDQDGIPDACDPCPDDNPNDTDGDGVCDSADVCPGYSDLADADGDGIPDACDPGVPPQAVPCGQWGVPLHQYPIDGSVISFTAGDLNGDGHVDFAVSDSEWDMVHLVFGNGDGTFASSLDLDVNGRPQFTTYSDMNNDGHTDIVTVLASPHAVSVAVNKGDGTFATPISYPTGNGLLELELADLDNDGDLDVLTTNQQSPNGFSVTRYFNSGDGTLYDRLDIDMGNSPQQLDVADIDGDGDMDAVVGQVYMGIIKLLVNDGTGNFTIVPLTVSHSNSWEWMNHIELTDLDGDSDVDLVYTATDLDLIEVYKNDGLGNFALDGQYTVGAAPAATLVADIDGNNRPDLLTANNGSEDVSVLLNLGDGTFGPEEVYPVLEQIPSFMNDYMRLGDVSGDGVLDLVVATQSDTSLFFGRGDGRFDFEQLLLTESGLDLELVDIDNDADVDVVVADYSSNFGGGLLFGINRGDGRFPSSEAPTRTKIGFFAKSVDQGDLNRDGLLDIAVVEDDAVSIYLGNGDGTFAASGTLTAGVGPQSITVADVDLDGHLDLLVSNRGTLVNLGTTMSGPWEWQDSSLSLFLGNGDGTFEAPVDIVTAGGNTQGVLVADLNGDGDKDLVVASPGERVQIGWWDPWTPWYENIGTNVAVHWNDGSTNFGAGQVFSPSPICMFGCSPEPPTSSNAPTGPLALGDIDGDGDLDPIIGNKVFTNGGGGAFGFGEELFFGPSALDNALFDIDDDGDLDLLLVTSMMTTGIDVAINDGTGSFAAPETVVDGIPQGSPLELIVEDFNNDGTLDLAVGGASASSVVVSMGMGAGQFDAATHIPFVRVIDAVVGDFDNDGDLDMAGLEPNNSFVQTTDGQNPVDLAADHFTVRWNQNIATDCNGNAIPDTCDLAAGIDPDC